MQKKSEIINIIIMCAAAPAAAIAGFFLLTNKTSYIAAAMIIILSMLPFFISFEKRKTGVNEIAVLASFTAAATVSRAAFYMLPQIKPIAAVVIIAAISFGYEVGFAVGALSMFLSGLLFGQGVWTPFQMLGLGLVGLISALIFQKSKYKHSRLAVSITGGILVFTVYGFIVDLSSVLYLTSSFTVKSVLTVYLSGLPMNAVFAVTTAVCLFVFSKPLTKRLLRLKTKYGIFEK